MGVWLNQLNTSSRLTLKVRSQICDWNVHN
uniref:Uncharacterized protein n=1 Tax=Anguilla anguilla TaxID=7936 RepID=A0A0E9V2B3_ANGAN